VIDQDIILVWRGERWIITGADILGRMPRGIAARREAVTEPRTDARSSRAATHGVTTLKRH